MMREFNVALLVAMVVLLPGGCGQTGVSPTSSPARPTPTFAPEVVRRAAVAGSFYPDNAEELTGMVDGYLEGVEPTTGRPIALIVPHAGYVYSGPVAAYAYAELRDRHYEAVVLIGPNHYLRELTGVAIYSQGAFETPLGLVPVHEELAQAILKANPAFEDNPLLHGREHSLEVQLPFLQRVLPGTPIVPILIGRPTPENCAALVGALSDVLPGRDVLLVASSDLSHYPFYDAAVEVDQALLAAIETMDTDVFRATIEEQMARGITNLVTTCCGEGAITVILEVAPRLGADRATVLHYANSGDVPVGDRSQVVGYGAVKFWSEQAK